jgi:hypothetical protein
MGAAGDVIHYSVLRFINVVLAAKTGAVVRARVQPRRLVPYLIALLARRERRHCQRHYQQRITAAVASAKTMRLNVLPATAFSCCPNTFVLLWLNGDLLYT